MVAPLDTELEKVLNMITACNIFNTFYLKECVSGNYDVEECSPMEILVNRVGCEQLLINTNKMLKR